MYCFFSSTSAPSASSISIKSPSIHPRHSIQVAISLSASCL